MRFYTAIKSQQPIMSAVFAGIVCALILACLATPSSWRKSYKSDISHFTASLRENQKAMMIFSQGPEPAPQEAIKLDISPEQLSQALAHLRAARTHAQNVSDDVLRRIHPELKQHYRYEFENGVNLLLTGIEGKDVRKQILGQMLIDKWLDWIHPRVSELNKRLAGL